MMDKRFEMIEHPSDVGMIAYGKTIRETFENAAFGMFSLMAELSDVSTNDSFTVEVKAEDREELFINWLNELIFLEDSKKVLLKEFKIESLTDKSLKATVLGEKIQANLHELHRPIKAATYNGLELKDTKAKVVFDV